jgi:2-polyprenyl-6-methoxyphenol hydroxylase-like FAD-dependent oxidoreductase
LSFNFYRISPKHLNPLEFTPVIIMAQPKRLRLAIIGAGPAGCTLARLLTQIKAHVDIMIYEGDRDLNERTQGGSLDLHTESGIEALKRCGLNEKFVKHARFDGEAFTVANKDLKKFIYMAGTKDERSTRGRPEIDRIQLRRILVDSLPEGLIRWGWHLKSVDQYDGTINLHFRDQGVESGFDLVVGAEGAWSKVRTFLSDEKPYFFGVSGVGLSISNPQERCPDLYKLVDKGSMFAFSESKSIMAQQLGNGRLNVSTWGTHPEEYIKIFDGKTNDPEFVKAKLMKEYENWHPQLLQIIEISDGPIVPRNLYMLPVGTNWKHHPGITMMGDAAHLMGPFAGEGVNLAMSDAMNLATAISNAARSLSASTDSAIDINGIISKEIKVFEEDMFTRAKRFQQMSFDMMEAMFWTPGAPDNNIEKWILVAAGHDLNFILRGLLASAAYTYFFFWRRWNGVGVKGWLW